MKKSKINEEKPNKSKRKVQSLLRILPIILIIAMFFSLLFIGLINLGVVDIPVFIKNIFNIGERPTEIIPGDDGRIIEALKNGKSSDVVTLIFDIDSLDLKEMLEESTANNKYYISNTVTVSSGGKDINKNNRIWRDGNMYRIEIYSENKLFQTIICDGENVFVSDADGKGQKYKNTDEFSLESQAGIPSPTDFLDNPDVTDLDITLVRSENDNVYKVTYSYIGILQYETVYISLEYGIVMNAETLYNDEIVYKMMTNEVGKLPEDTEKLFNID